MSDTSNLSALVDALTEQTAALNELAASNRQLVSVIADLLAEEVEQDPDAEPTHYMDGSLIQ